jgi:polyisoprenoid-binding protein YceI
MKKFLATALFASIAGSAIAAPTTYVLEPNHTLPRFEYNHMGYSIQSSRFNKVTGKVVLDKAAKTGSADVTIDTTSIDTGSTMFNEHIQGEDFLSTAKFPTATYKSSKFVFKGEKLVAIEGDLTIKGVTKPVKLAVSSYNCAPHPMMKKEACGVNATAKIKRSDFGAGKYAPLVGDDVTIIIPVEAIAE